MTKSPAQIQNKPIRLNPLAKEILRYTKKKNKLESYSEAVIHLANHSQSSDIAWNTENK
jgi:hypothetical protein